MIAERDKQSVDSKDAEMNESLRKLDEKRKSSRLLDNKESLISECPNRSERAECDDTEQPEACYARCFFLRAKNLDIVLKMVPDPERAVDRSREEHAAPSPAMEEVEFLPSMSGTQ